MGLGMSEVPLIGLGMSEAPLIGLGMSEVPLMGLGMSKVPLMGLGMSKVPLMGLGMSKVPLMGLGMSKVPLMGLGVSAVVQVFLASLQIGVAAEKALDNLAQANEALRVDIEKWREAKDIELGVVMRRVADGHIKYHQKVWGGGSMEQGQRSGEEGPWNKG